MDVADEAVVATNADASLCKYQAVTQGYYKDEFLALLVGSKLLNSHRKRAPEISRGYYTRICSITYIVEQFVQRYQNCQIISVGGGYDSLFWRLKSQKFLSTEDTTNQIRYVEIDMSPVVLHKMMAIKRHPKLHKLLSNFEFRGEGLYSDEYNLIPFDLRQVDKEPLTARLKDDCKLNMELPTLCLAECVLIYMSLHDSNSLIDWLTSTFKSLSMVNYEQCNMDDRFGFIMLENMNSRNCDLLGVEACKNLDSQKARFTTNGLSVTKAWTLSDIYNQIISPHERDRIEKIEFLDEKELLEQLLDHYCVAVGSHQAIDWIPEDQHWLARTLM